jgi:hypothetical protein
MAETARLLMSMDSIHEHAKASKGDLHQWWMAAGRGTADWH